MITVNLLKNIGASAHGSLAKKKFSLFGSMKSASGPLDQKELSIKIGLIVSFMVILVGYEFLHIMQREDELSVLTKQKAEYDVEIGKLGSLVAEVEQFIKERESLIKKFEIIGKLAEKRTSYVQAVDTLQTLLPEKVWFTEVTFEGKNVKLKGDSTEDNAILDFVKGIEDNVYFSDVVLTSAVEVKTNTGVIKRFEIIFVLEKG